MACGHGRHEQHEQTQRGALEKLHTLIFKWARNVTAEGIAFIRNRCGCTAIKFLRQIERIPKASKNSWITENQTIKTY